MESFKIINFSLPILFIVFSQFSYLLSASNSERALKTGDTFTPGELLPVAIKLMEKIENPGSGKGIVSISKNAEDLADRLFETFFMTSKRFVTLTEFDIKGLDALQALALSGDSTSKGQVVESVTEEPVTAKVELKLRGQFVKVNTEGLKCKYRLLTKQINNKLDIKRRGIELEKKLSKKRRIIVKSRKTNAEERPMESRCRWRYECSNPGDLDSCQLHSQCGFNDTMTTANYIGAQKNIDHKELEYINSFRKMIGITDVDEEVEKILETRMLHVKPNKLDTNDRVESLAEYFHKIILAQAIVESTTPVTNNYGNAQPEGSNEPTESVINSENSQNEDNDNIGSVQDIKETKRMSHKKRQF